ncbi:MAG TPA: AsmA family protein [Terriglobales bacterium]|nr:AsmA family protein [Terriglobales bacterium]
MIFRSQRRFLLAAIAIFLLAAFVVPAINVGRYRVVVSRSLSAALGREVTVRQVSMHLLPMPGLTLSGLVVGDDPRFSAEPILRADEVTATLRLTSLWRGRLEISQLSLSDPSLNLVRLPSGQWNVESLFERVRETPVAPTSKTRPEVRSRFPYIESTGGRINLKLGLEKTVYALNDADFALWLASEDEWRMRLEARPMRTDSNLSDTGTIRIEGSARRAASLGETPLVLRATWERGQLGQITTLLRGSDAGWRGTVQLNANLTGTPHNLHIATESTIQDFRRYDIFSGDSLVLYAKCTAQYNNLSRSFSDISCVSPAGSGQIQVQGTADLSTPRSYGLSFSLTKIPAQFAVNLARHSKLGMASDLTAVGTLDGEFTLKTKDGQRLWAGNGTTSEWEIRSSQLGNRQLVVSAMQLSVPDSLKNASLRNTPKTTVAGANRLGIRPFVLNLGAATPTSVSGWINASSYHFVLQGDADLRRALQVSGVFGLYSPAAAMDGNVHLNGQLDGEWAHFEQPLLTGHAELRNATATLKGFGAPLHIATADVTADSDHVALQNLTLAFAKPRVAATGSLELPRHCQPSPDCELTFYFKSDSLSVDDLNRIVNPKAWDRPWYERLVGGNSDSGAPWHWIFARGHIAAQRLTLKAVPATKASADIEMRPDSVGILNVRATLLGGTYQGQLMLAVGKDQPLYESKGQFDHISMSELAALMKDGWATGTLSLSYDGTATGWQAGDLLSSASVSGDFDWRTGTLPHLILANDGQPLTIQHFAGKVAFQKGSLNISEGKLQNHSGIYRVSGNASLGRDLNITLTGDSSIYSIGGTLARPRVAPVENESKQASLRGTSR